VMGIAVSYGGVSLFRALATTMARFDLGDTVTVPRLSDITIDRTVLLFALGATVSCALLFGIMPAIRALETGHLSVHRRPRLQRLLVTVEIARGLPLVVAGGLLLRSFINVVGIDPGFDPSHALTFQIALRGDRYTPIQLKRLSQGLIDRLSAMPDVV